MDGLHVHERRGAAEADERLRGDVALVLVVGHDVVVSRRRALAEADKGVAHAAAVDRAAEADERVAHRSTLLHAIVVILSRRRGDH